MILPSRFPAPNEIIDLQPIPANSLPPIAKDLKISYLNQIQTQLYNSFMQSEDHLFVGDTIFMPYVGTARADFPGGSAKDLYLSIQKIFNLVDDTKIHVGHDYPLEKEKPQSTSTVAIQKAKNVMISKNTTLEDFVAIRNKADANKSVPKLLIPALQFNLRAGALGQPEQNGLYYIKIPIN